MSKPARPYQPFVLLEQPTVAPDDVLDFAREFIAKNKWIFAKTMPESPHEYCLRRNCYANGTEPDFVHMVEMIRLHGYKGRFHRTRLTYMNVDDRRYWSMGAPIRRYPNGAPAFDSRGVPQWPADETILINRASNEDFPTPCCNLSMVTGGKHHARDCRRG